MANQSLISGSMNVWVWILNKRSLSSTATFYRQRLPQSGWGDGGSAESTSRLWYFKDNPVGDLMMPGHNNRLCICECLYSGLLGILNMNWIGICLKQVKFLKSESLENQGEHVVMFSIVIVSGCIDFEQLWTLNKLLKRPFSAALGPIHHLLRTTSYAIHSGAHPGAVHPTLPASHICTQPRSSARGRSPGRRSWRSG